MLLQLIMDIDIFWSIFNVIAAESMFKLDIVIVWVQIDSQLTIVKVLFRNLSFEAAIVIAFFDFFLSFKIYFVLILVFLIHGILVRFRVILNLFIPVWLLSLIQALFFEVLVSEVVIEQVLLILLVQLPLLNPIFVLIDLFLWNALRIFYIITFGAEVLPLLNLTFPSLILSDDSLGLFFVVLYEFFQDYLLLPFHFLHFLDLKLFLSGSFVFYLHSLAIFIRISINCFLCFSPSPFRFSKSLSLPMLCGENLLIVFCVFVAVEVVDFRFDLISLFFNIWAFLFYLNHNKLSVLYLFSFTLDFMIRFFGSFSFDEFFLFVFLKNGIELLVLSLDILNILSMVLVLT